jgi:hypothetical protein
VIVAFVAGIMMWARYYIPTTQSLTVESEFTRWLRIIAGFAALLGLLSVLEHHRGKIRLKRTGYGYSYITLVGFLVMALAGILPFAMPGFAEKNLNSDSFYIWLYDWMFVPMQATMFSILAFFIASAAFRAFRARSFEATALLIAGIIVMIGRVPVGDALATALESRGLIWPWVQNQYALLDFPAVTSWLLSVPNQAAQRGILLGVLLSQIAIAIRIIFGIERTYMGGGD